MSATHSSAAEVIALETAALKRWLAGDPSGFLEISDEDVVYFDPFLERRLDGLAALTNYYEALRGKISAPRFEIVNPKAQVFADAIVLTFNFVSWSESWRGDALELHGGLRAARRRVEDRPDALVVHRRAGRLSRRLRNARRGPKFAGMDQLSSAADNPLLEPWDTPFGAPPFDRIRPEHFAPAFDAALAAAAGRDRRDRRRSGRAELRQHDRRLGARRRAAQAGERGVLPPRQRRDQRRDRAHRARHCAGAVARTQRDPARRRAVRPRRRALSGARASRPRRRSGADARTLARRLHPRRRRPRRRQEGAAGGDRRTAGEPRRAVRPERARRREGVRARSRRAGRSRRPAGELRRRRGAGGRGARPCRQAGR